MSVLANETINFKVKTPATKYRVDVFRLGYYGGKVHGRSRRSSRSRLFRKYSRNARRRVNTSLTVAMTPKSRSALITSPDL